MCYLPSTWFLFNDSKATIQVCCIVGILCSAYNLFGDLYYMDFFHVHCSDDSFGMIRDEPRSGYLFTFDQSNTWMVLLVQTGGWIYPIWAVATVIPIYLGFENVRGADENNQDLSDHSGGPSLMVRQENKGFGPCFLMAYGLCIVGGAFHGAFAFSTVLPNVVHYPTNSYYEGWSDLMGTSQFSQLLEMAQTQILIYIFSGGLPGLLAYFISSIWLAVLVQFRPHHHRFPKWYNLFNPIATNIWVNVISGMIPDPIGTYFAGCFGTWGLLLLNVGTAYCVLTMEGGDEGVGSRSSLLNESVIKDDENRDYKTIS